MIFYICICLMYIYAINHMKSLGHPQIILTHHRQDSIKQKAHIQHQLCVREKDRFVRAVGNCIRIKNVTVEIIRNSVIYTHIYNYIRYTKI